MTLKGIRLKTERDGWSHEEFELWYGVPIEIQGYTIMRPLIRYGWKMNGHNRLDASGTTRYFSDVNKKDKWYADNDQNVRLMALGDDKKAMVAWEDDWNEGQIDRKCLIPNLVLATGDVIRANTSNYDAWNLANNRIETQVELSTKIDGTWFWNNLDDDDRFSQSAVTNITNGNVQALSPGATSTSLGNTFHSENAINATLGDVKYRFARSTN